MRTVIADTLALCGIGGTIAGAAWWSPGAAAIVAGLWALYLAVALTNKSRGQQ